MGAPPQPGLEMLSPRLSPPNLAPSPGPIVRPHPAVWPGTTLPEPGNAPIFIKYHLRPCLWCPFCLLPLGVDGEGGEPYLPVLNLGATWQLLFGPWAPYLSPPQCPGTIMDGRLLPQLLSVLLLLLWALSLRGQEEAPAEEDGVLVLNQSTLGQALREHPALLLEFCECNQGFGPPRARMWGLHYAAMHLWLTGAAGDGLSRPGWLQMLLFHRGPDPSYRQAQLPASQGRGMTALCPGPGLTAHGPQAGRCGQISEQLAEQGKTGPRDVALIALFPRRPLVWALQSPGP